MANRARLVTWLATSIFQCHLPAAKRNNVKYFRLLTANNSKWNLPWFSSATSPWDIPSWGPLPPSLLCVLGPLVSHKHLFFLTYHTEMLQHLLSNQNQPFLFISLRFTRHVWSVRRRVCGVVCFSVHKGTVVAAGERARTARCLYRETPVSAPDGRTTPKEAGKSVRVTGC